MYAVKHKVVLLVQWQFLALSLTCHACTVQTHIQIVLDRPQLIAVLRTRHLALVKIHGCDSLTVATVFQITINLIFESGLIRLVADLAVVPIDGSKNSRPRQASIIDLVIIAT